MGYIVHLFFLIFRFFSVLKYIYSYRSEFTVLSLDQRWKILTHWFYLIEQFGQNDLLQTRFQKWQSFRDYIFRTLGSHNLCLPCLKLAEGITWFPDTVILIAFLIKYGNVLLWRKQHREDPTCYPDHVQTSTQSLKSRFSEDGTQLAEVRSSVCYELNRVRILVIHIYYSSKV